MAHIILKDIVVNGVNMHDKNRKLWNLLRGKKPSPVKILKNINFEAKNGDRIGILGKNGNGKSSIIKVITGIYPPHEGTIDINGKILSIIEGGVGMSFSLPAIDTVKMAFVYNNAISEYSSELSDEIFKFAELEDFKNISPSQYSSGMKARLSIASSLFQKGNIALFDEMLAMTDSNFHAKAMSKLNQIWNEVDIGIFISHNIEEIKKLCNKCYVIDKGETIAYGNVEDMIKVYNKLLV